jgi:regulator of sigma E protease
MSILIRILQLLLSLSLLVFFHELGHFLWAKLFRIRVSKFYLFFDWKFSLWHWKPKGSDTEYGIGWLPLGGYCAIDGMIDEQMAETGVPSEPEPWEFRAKPKWQRFLVLFGGVLNNVIMAILIYWGIAFHYGIDRIPMEGVGDALTYTSVGHRMGLEDGDRPYAIDGEVIDYFEGAIVQDIANAETLTVMRAGSPVDIAVPEDLIPALLETDSAFFYVDLPSVADSVLAGSNAALAGMQRGDEVIALDGTPMTLSKLLPAIKESRGDTILLTVQRGTETLELPVYADEENGIGVMFSADIGRAFGQVHEDYRFFEALPNGVSRSWAMLTSYVDQLKYVATPQGVKSLGGLGTIGSLFSPVWDWLSFWTMTAFLSIVLAVMNLIPIPGLDGGHILFLLIEAIVRRPIPYKYMQYIQLFGLALLFILMIYANVADIFRFLL